MMSVGDKSDDTDQMRHLFANTPSLLLATTCIATLLHLVFELLAFKNDVLFYQSCDAESLSRFVSIRSIAVGIVGQFVLLLNLYDEGGNVIVLGFTLISICVDVWKVGRAMRLSTTLLWGVLPVCCLEYKAKFPTIDDFDSIAMKWLALVLVPIAVCYGIYTLCFDCHKGWYSFCLAWTARSVYSGGFVLIF